MKKFIYTTLCAITLLVSCDSYKIDSDRDFTNTTEKKIRLYVSVPNSQQTRAISETSETNINSIQVLAFKVNDDGSEVYQYSTVANKAPDESGGYNVTVRAQENKQRFVLIANADAQVTLLTDNFTTWNGQSKETMLSKLEFALEQNENQWNATNDSDYTDLPMWGETEQQIIDGTTTAINAKVDLMRMLAKIDVQLDQSVAGLTDKFKLKSVYLYNTNNKGNIVPKQTALKSTSSYKTVTVPTIPADASRIEGPIKYTDFTSPGIENIAMRGAIYTFETKIPSDGDKLKETCLVIGGLYDGDEKETYYRIDLIAKDANGNNVLLDVLRNHKYLVSIIKVSGSGYETPDIAYRSNAVNINTNILHWDEANLNNITFDGQNYLGVSASSLTLWKREFKDKIDEDYNMFSVLTDYVANVEGAKSGWYVESITDAATGKEEDAKWLSLSATEGAANVIAKVGVYVEQNTTNLSRSAIITIAAGRLRFNLKITQLNKEILALEILNEDEQRVSYLNFKEYPEKAPAPQKITIKWTPADANVSVAATQLTSHVLTGTGLPVAGVISNIETGEITYTIQPDAFGANILEKNPFAEKIINYTFTITDGENVVNESIVIRQGSYNMTFNVDGNGYVLGGQTEEIVVYSNYAWKISDVEDPYDIIQGENEMKGLEGGNNIVQGDTVSFKMANPTVNFSKQNKQALVHLVNLDSGEDKVLIIRAEEHLYVGYFSGKMVEDADGGRRYERKIYIQNENESNAIIWQNNKNYTYVMNYVQGKTNTLQLMQYSRNNTSTDFPAARACFEKNRESGSITKIDDHNYVWYMPAVMQLYAVWVVESSFQESYRMSEGFYWSSVEYPGGTSYGSGGDAWVCNYTTNMEGHTYYGPGKLSASQLRCVREVK